MAPSRRSFLNSFGSLIGLAVVSPGEAMKKLGDTVQPSGATDEEIVAKTFDLAARRGLAGEELGEIIAVVGGSFTGAPYEAHTLEVPGPERLVVDLRTFDCTTFVESMLALARCVRLATPTFEAFKEQLQKIRYRNGVIQGYPSRLHYFIDWLGDNEAKGIVRNITHDLGGVSITKPIDFMTTHTSAYHQLSDKANVAALAEVEKRLSARAYAVLPKRAVENALPKIQNGDVVALATLTQGLDVSHVGFAVRSGNTVKFLHAPLSGGSVTLSEHSLSEFVAGVAKATGIIVGRPLKP